MKHLKQGIAAFLAALLIMPTLPAAAEGTTAPAASEADQVWFNTGNLAVSVIDPSVSENEAYQSQWMDLFAADGSYTINIPEENPFFPYEVQFTCNGETTNEWFMNPEDTVEVGGHVFHVNACFDNTVVTQMNLEIAGKEVTVYPKEKDFTNDGNGVAEQSLLPLTERNLVVDLTGFTPVELTQVSTSSIFTGVNELEDTTQIAWTRKGAGYSDYYVICQAGDDFNLSVDTAYGTSNYWTMIVGSADQLDSSDIKYNIETKHVASSDWLQASVYLQDDTGARKKAEMSEVSYSDSEYYDRSLRAIFVDEGNTTAYVNLQVNSASFAIPNYASIKAFDGAYDSAEEAEQATDISNQIFTTDMSGKNAGVPLYVENTSGGSTSVGFREITLVTYDNAGNATGCLALLLDISSGGDCYIDSCDLYAKDTQNNYEYVSYDYDINFNNATGAAEKTYVFYENYPVNGTYYASFNYVELGYTKNNKVTAAYAGFYNSIAEAQAAGAKNIKDELFLNGRGNNYQADFSQGVNFTVFVGGDGSGNQEIYKYTIFAKQGDVVLTEEDADYRLSSSSAVTFYGLLDQNGNEIKTYTIGSENDSYGEYNYQVMVVPEGTDLSRVAPEFYTITGVKLYAEGGNTPEESGKSYHDLTGGTLHYTASAEDGIAAKNYWLQVVTVTGDQPNLFINSLNDKNANTEVKNGVTYSTREIMLDGYHQYRHDIFLANTGRQPLKNLKAELVSDTLEMDEYWTLSGNFDLKGFDATASAPDNIAKIRLTAKANVDSGTEITGTLTIKSGEKTVMVLNLTGIAGDPVITTTEIPEAVKYVPYGTMIQNNNKYSWNKVTYTIQRGSLPQGMELKANGEIYGVPREAGEYVFTVRMNNTGRFGYDSLVTYRMIVQDNTNENVEKATDAGYELKERVQTVYLGAIPSNSDERGDYLRRTKQRMVSQGEYAEYVAVYLDGKKLQEGKDYISEAGSTRITLTYQTLIRDMNSYNRTLAIEFREKGTDTLKRAAQNFEISREAGNNINVGNGGNSPDSGNDSGDSDSTGSVVTAGTVQTITYTVQPGDTLSKIAKKYLGNASLWRKIYEDNKATIKNPNLIRVGQKLIINLSGNAEGEAKTTAVSSNANTYVVQPGDNLWKIAKKVYGQGFAWRRIFEANRNVISNPRTIHVGQQLLIP